jgi:PKD repeat protein
MTALRNPLVLVLSVFLLLVISREQTHAVDSVCARVKIEIKQEVTFERQAFDAHMHIENGLTTMALEQVGVEVMFTDEDGVPVFATSNPDHPDALFFIRISSMEGIEDVSGSGVVGAASEADIHWLIVPAPAAVNPAVPTTLYFVGARLTYTLGGEEQITEVTPDYINVKPLPLFTLDYFLPDDVYGDDPFTDATEPSIPFSLGVRVMNNGHGTAYNFKIDSAQPRIIENELGLLVDFQIEGSEVDGVLIPNTLLINFGDIEPNQPKIGRWLMTSSLSGRFVEFVAQYSHAEEFGGELTSLIEDVRTHVLVRDVLVDEPGRDEIRDFLALDDGQYTVYESDAGVTEVTDRSSTSVLTFVSATGPEMTYSLTTTPTAGFSYLQLDDPLNGTKLLIDVTRSDGKKLSVNNGWISGRRVEDQWSYYLNLFDTHGTESYTLTFLDPSAVDQPPEFLTDEIPVEKEGELIEVLIRVGDPDQPVQLLSTWGALSMEQECEIEISVDRLPVGAEFVDLGNGTGILRWNAEPGQAGDYPLEFTARDCNDQEATARYHLVVTDIDNVPTATFSATPLSGAVPLDVLFVDESTSVDGIATRVWDFGDGGGSSQETPFYTYTVPGTYPVTLTVTEPDGDTDTRRVEDYIRVTGVVDGRLRVLLTDESGTPLPDVRAQLFDTDGNDQGRSAVTTSEGYAEFTANGGTYQIRAEYLGYEFWSDPFVHATMDTTVDMTIAHREVTIQVVADAGDGISAPLGGLPVHLYRPDGEPIDLEAVTTEEGTARFRVPQRTYKALTTYADTAYWSDTLMWQDTTIAIEHGLVDVAVLADGEGAPGIRVDLLDETGALMQYALFTDSDGMARFMVVPGAYRFRAEYQGYYYTGDVVQVAAFEQLSTTLNTRGSAVVLTYTDQFGTPLAGLTVAVLDAEGADFGDAGITDAAGSVGFDLPDGSYRAVVFYLGTEQRSEPFAIPNTSTLSQVIDHRQVTITLQTAYDAHLSSLSQAPVALLDGSGGELGVETMTDSAGAAHFYLPYGSFQVRVWDYTTMYESGPFSNEALTMTLPRGAVRVSLPDEVEPRDGVPLRVMDGAGVELPLSLSTNAEGAVELFLPPGGYRFEAGNYAAELYLVADQYREAELELVIGGGDVTILVSDQNGRALTNLPVTLFDLNRQPLEFTGITDERGLVTMTVPTGSYLAGVEYLYKTYFSDPLGVAGDTTAVIEIEHRPVTVKVVGRSIAGEPAPLFNYAYNVYLYAFDESFSPPRARILPQQWRKRTDGNGEAVFMLPDARFKVAVRVPFIAAARQYSAPFGWEGVELEVPVGRLEVRFTYNGGRPARNMEVFLNIRDYSIGITDDNGVIRIDVPAARNYRLRVYDSPARWRFFSSNRFNVEDGQTLHLDVNLDTRHGW